MRTRMFSESVLRRLRTLAVVLCVLSYAGCVGAWLRMYTGSMRTAGLEGALFVGAIGIVLFVAMTVLLKRKTGGATTLDPLTNLLNRGSFLTQAEQMLHSRPTKGFCAIFLIDLDRFQEVNERLGHLAGDQVLAAVGPRVQSVLRRGDLVGRFGGDEFAILASDISSEQDMTLITRRLVRQLQEPCEIEGVVMGIESTVGAVLIGPDQNNLGELLRQADQALCMAKRERRTVMVYHEELESDRLASPPELLGELRHAVQRGELRVHYQPKFSLATGFPVGMESLVRWAHPSGRLIPPGEFIALAEQTAVIHPLTRFVLDESLRQCREWLDRGWRLPVAVNVSADCFYDPSFTDSVVMHLNRHRVAADLLTLEITETTAIADPQRVKEQLDTLRSFGIIVSLDDFGVGYSSLTSLNKWPIDEVKIDRSLIANITRNQRDAAIVRAVMDLGAQLKLRVVAEGAEDNETCDLLMSFGCEVAQGFKWMRPLPAEDLDAFLENAMARSVSSPI
jgi:diguanylate cyclase